MTTDRQKICKCGANVIEFLNDTRTLEMYLAMAKAENSSIYTPAFKSSADSIHMNISKIEDDCNIDMSNTKRSCADMFKKMEKTETIKDSTKFDERRTDILRDIDRIVYDISQKIKECSK